MIKHIVRACVCACVRVCVCACVRVWVCACVRVEYVSFYAVRKPKAVGSDCISPYHFRHEDVHPSTPSNLLPCQMECQPFTRHTVTLCCSSCFLFFVFLAKVLWTTLL